MKKKQKSSGEDVELNMTAMLDMAFQILAFFVLTFRPPVPEGQIALRMPPPMPVAGKGTEEAGQSDKPQDVLKNFTTLLVIVTATDSGDIRQMYVGKAPDQQEIGVDPKLKTFGNKMASLLNNPASPFDQVVIQVGSKLRYSELMKIIDVCTKQTIGGDPKHRLSKLSLVDENG